MPGKRRSDDLFGGASIFIGSQLPTHQEVGQAWEACRLELQAENPGMIVSKRTVAKKVKQFFFWKKNFLSLFPKLRKVWTLRETFCFSKSVDKPTIPLPN